MDWRMDTYSLCTWVSPFRYLRIIAYLQLPEAFRSLSRLSSALSAKASTLRSLLLNHTCKNKPDCIALQSLCCSKELRYISISSCYFFDVSLHLRHFCRPRMSCLIISSLPQIIDLRFRDIRQISVQARLLSSLFANDI